MTKKTQQLVRAIVGLSLMLHPEQAGDSAWHLAGT